jgi:heptosyltransferase-2
MLLMLIGIKKRIGFNYRNRGRFLTSKVDIKNFDDKHVIDHYMDVLKLLNVDFKELSIRPKICVSQDDLKWADKVLADKGLGGTDTIVGLVCGCGASWGPDAIRRRWDKKRFAELADRMIDRYKAKVILLGDKKECEISRDVAKAMKNSVVDLCGETSVGQMAALISRCNVVITNDGGPLHIAVGLGVKTVSIFGPVNEAVYGPYPKDEKHIVITNNGVTCRPCYKKFRYNKCNNRVCLDSISVDEVYAAVEKAIER